MKQRVPRMSWRSSGTGRRRPRLLIEDDRPALAISDFTMFRQAGLDVAFCSGPGADPEGCPLLGGRGCALVAAADVVLCGLDPRLGVAAAIRRHHPRTPVVVEPRHGEQIPAEAPAGCLTLPFACSVPGQVDAVLRALPARTA